MRQAFMETKWLLDESGALLGIQLGFDFAAEHECGIDGLIWSFGLDPEACGIDRTRIRKLPAGLGSSQARGWLSRVTIKDPPHAFEGLVLYKREGRAEVFLQNWRNGTRRMGPSEGKLLCGWDKDSFGLFCNSADGKSHVDELHEAFKALDISIESHRRGLAFRIISRIPAEEKDRLWAQDLDEKRLKQVALGTGIESELRAAGKRWYALRPQWADDRRQSVVFYLNPADQHLHDCGWFSVDDLRLWAQGQGPVMLAQRGVL